MTRELERSRSIMVIGLQDYDEFMKGRTQEEEDKVKWTSLKIGD